MKKIWNFIKPTLLGDDGKASYRRFTTLLFTILDVYLVHTGRINSDIMLNVHYSILVFIGALIGLITTQNIIDFKNGKNTNNNDSDYITK